MNPRKASTTLAFEEFNGPKTALGTLHERQAQGDRDFHRFLEACRFSSGQADHQRVRTTIKKSGASLARLWRLMSPSEISKTR